MTARQFTAVGTATAFVITEIAPDGLGTASRELAWQRARSQAAPVTFVALDGTRRELGDCFDVETFERAMYSGHISYELSMTDGHYAPEPFETWVAEFRKFPSVRYNDASAATKAAMDRYLAA